MSNYCMTSWRTSSEMRAASLQLARTHTRFTHCARFARDEIINSLRSALREESNLMHDVHNNMVPSGILNLFQKTSSCHYYNTRASASGNFYVNSSDLELYKLSFSRFGAKLWNEISCHIRHLPKNKFKKTLRKLLFDILNSEDDYIDTPTLIKKVKLAKNVEK